jgi:hypothetical protein
MSETADLAAPPTRERKFQELRRVLINAKDDRLHMRMFCVVGAPCGTAYCLAGFAAIDDWFAAHTPINEYLKVEYDGSLTVVAHSGRYVGKGLAEIFEISEPAAEALFAIGLCDAMERKLCEDPHFITKDEVLANIDALLAGREPTRYDAEMDGEDADDEEWEEEIDDDEEPEAEES